MLLPNVKGIKRNRIRDSQIIRAYLENGQTEQVIANAFNISRTRVSQILMNNATEAISAYKDYSKVKRLNFFERAKNCQDIPLAPSQLAVIEAERREFEKDTQVTNVTQFLQINAPTGTENRLSINTNSQPKLSNSTQPVVEI